MAIRFVERSGFFAKNLTDQGLNYINPDSYMSFLLNLNNALSWIGYLVLFCLVLLFICKLKLKTKDVSNKMKLVSFLIVIPLILHFIIFFNLCAIHFGSFAKLAIAFAFLAAFVIHKFSILKIKFTEYLTPLLVISFIVAAFFSIETLKNYLPQNEFLQNRIIENSKTIVENSSDDESIFIEFDGKFNPEIVYLSYISKRNMMFVNDINDAKELLQEYKKTKGVIYRLESELANKEITHFSIPPDK